MSSISRRKQRRRGNGHHSTRLGARKSAAQLRALDVPDRAHVRAELRTARLARAV